MFMLNRHDFFVPGTKAGFAPHMRAIAKSVEGNSMIYKFQVGQSVALIARSLRQAAPGTYEIVRLMPANETEPYYRIKSEAERHERVVAESELETSLTS
jgi:hypothetical protein